MQRSIRQGALETTTTAMGTKTSNNNSTRAAHFLVHFFAVTVRLPREIPIFQFFNLEKLRQSLKKRQVLLTATFQFLTVTSPTQLLKLPYNRQTTVIRTFHPYSCLVCPSAFHPRGNQVDLCHLKWGREIHLTNVNKHVSKGESLSQN